MIGRRLRAIVRTTVATCIPWTALGIIIGVVLQLQHNPGAYFLFNQRVPGGGVTVFGIAGVLVGIVNGLMFSGLVATAERGKSVEQLSRWRFAIWGALAAAAPLALLTHTVVITGIGAAIGAAGSYGMLWAARRATSDDAAHLLGHGSGIEQADTH